MRLRSDLAPPHGTQDKPRAAYESEAAPVELRLSAEDGALGR